MRILILSFYYVPDLCAGSFRTATFVEELGKVITLDDKVEVITTMPNRYGNLNVEVKKFEKISKNIEINRINIGTHKSGFIDQSKLFLRFMFKVFRLVKEKENYDVVYSTSSRLMTAFLGAMIANKQKARLYLDIRDIFTDTLESVFIKSKLRYVIPIFKQVEKYTVNSANHINLVSKGFESYFQKINSNMPYSFYTNGIDDFFLNYNFNSEKINKKNIITYAGNIGEGQGLERIIPEMAQKLGNNYEIHVIGDGSKKKSLIDALDGIRNVKFFDPVTRVNLLEIYKKSDILFLHLNDCEAFKKVLPSKLFEYAATNKFIIAGVAGYAKEFIEENVSDVMIFEPCNIEDFSDKFNQVIKFNDICRDDFILKFKRGNIMKSMAIEVYSI